jgi:hypothetical protein
MNFVFQILYLSVLFVNNYSMLVQLSNGRTVYMTVDEYLNLTHEEEQYLISINYGEIVSNPFFSQFSGRSRELDLDDEDDDPEYNITGDSLNDDLLDIPDENLDF